MICDEAHTALGEKTSAAIRSFPEPIYIGMTATEQLIAKQVSDVFPASVDDLPLQDAARRGLIAPLRDLRVPPVAAINSVPIVGGDFDQEILAKTLDHQALNQAAASLYRDRFDNTPGIVYAAGVDHAYNLAQGVPRGRAEGRGGLGPDAAGAPRRDARRLRARRDQRPHQRAAARRGLELAARDGLHAPRADSVEARLPAADRPHHAPPSAQGGGDRRRLRPEGRDAQRARRLAPLASRRRLLPRGRARHSGAAPPLAAPRAPPPHAGAVARAGHARRPPPLSASSSASGSGSIPKYLDEDEQRYWATIAGRQIRFDERASFVQKLTDRSASKAALEQFLTTAAAENPNRRLRMMALQDRVSMRVERADFDDLVTLVTQAPTWEKERLAGIRILLRAIGEEKPDAPEQILARWTWRLARATRKVQDRRASAEYPEAKRLLGALANSRGHRHEENAAKLVKAALELPLPVGAALLASAEGYTPRATKLIDEARERLGTVQEVALALAENLPAPKQGGGRTQAAPAAEAQGRRREARGCRRRRPRLPPRTRRPTRPRSHRARPRPDRRAAGLRAGSAPLLRRPARPGGAREARAAALAWRRLVRAGRRLSAPHRRRRAVRARKEGTSRVPAFATASSRNSQRGSKPQESASNGTTRFRACAAFTRQTHGATASNYSPWVSSLLTKQP